MELLTMEEKNELRKRLLQKEPTKQTFSLLEQRELKKKEENIKRLKDNLNKHLINLNRQLDKNDGTIPFGMSVIRKEDLELQDLKPVEEKEIIVTEEE